MADRLGINHTDFRCIDIIQRRGRVLVEITPELERKAEEFYAPVAELGNEVFGRYTDEELERAT